MDKVKECTIRPSTSLTLLSHQEISAAMETRDEVFQTFRNCALAVLNTGNETDDATEMLQEYADFSIVIIPEPRGIKLLLKNAPATAFVDGKLIRGIQENLFATLRDIVYTQARIGRIGGFNIETPAGITDTVFRVLRNAGIVKPNQPPNLVVCWGGHAINRVEYEYSKHVGYMLGLRGLDIATGCGTGAMKGPMKGAMIGHAKQMIKNGRYVGISEPGIIASEPPNPTVNELVVLPDIEKRLEAFVRVAHAIVVFPGGVGTVEEIFYLLGILMREENQQIPLPVIFTSAVGHEEYFKLLDKFIRNTLGEAATKYYEIVTGDAEQVARLTLRNINRVVAHRRSIQESYAFNWGLHIPSSMQKPFEVSHRNMAALNLSRESSTADLIAELRRAFSGIVAGNVKPLGIRQIKSQGVFKLQGDASLMREIDNLLSSFVTEGRMKVNTDKYIPCYELLAPAAEISQ